MTQIIQQIHYKTEYIAGFERAVDDCPFRAAAIDEAIITGNKAMFVTYDTGGARAVTRGVDGKIPPRPMPRTQNEVNLVEWHDRPEATDFTIFASQGDAALQRKVMQETSFKVINYTIQDMFINELSATPNNTGAATVASVNLVGYARRRLAANDIPTNETANMFCALTPAMEQILLQTTDYTSADYVDVKPLAGNGPTKMRLWMGINFFVCNHLQGRETNAEKALMWHRNAVGFAYDSRNIRAEMGYDAKEDHWWARASMYGGVKLIQPAGAIIINHDATAVTA